MGYDGLDRLTNTSSPMFGAAGYAYDTADNLVQATVSGGSQPRTHYYCYSASTNRLDFVRTGPSCSTSPAAIALAYDVQGNLSVKNGASYAFDVGNRLRSVAGLSYRYDGLGRRVRQDSGGGQRRYSMYAQDGRVVWQRDEVAGRRINNVYFAGSLLAELSRPLGSETATVSYVHTDALGSPIAKTNSAGAVIETSEYEPYGLLLNRINDDRVGYTGHVMDAASGLIYMQQRYYDPQIGRFLSVDPVTAYEKPLTNFNRYSYAFNNPYRFSDPDGRDGVPIVFPDYKITVGPLKVPGLGHAGVLLIDNKNGHTKYYEYGRYDKGGKGIVRTVPVSNVTMGKDGKPTPQSMQKVLGQISEKAGHGGAIQGAYVKNDNFAAMQGYAEGRMAQNSDQNREGYSLTSNNCATFATSVINAGDSSFKSSAVVPTSAVGDWQSGHEKVTYDPPEKKQN